jgi:ubiquinone/menaquinone biosynthesis C-methylase UbiE
MAFSIIWSRNTPSSEQETDVSSYILGASQGEEDRLVDHLESFGQKKLLSQLKPGMRCLDVGCGPGAVSAMLAEAVGPEGSVEGLDMQEEQVERARALARKRGLENVTFRVGNATELPWDEGEFDLVYAKFLVMHLPDPEAGLGEMRRVLASGGTLFSYEFDAGGAVYWPKGTPTESAWNLAMGTLAEGGSDTECGRKLYSYFCRLGLQDIRAIPEMTGACPAQPRAYQGLKRQVVGVLKTMEERIVGSGKMTREAFAEVVEAVMTDQPEEFFTTAIVACWGTKP